MQLYGALQSKAFHSTIRWGTRSCSFRKARRCTGTPQGVNAPSPAALGMPGAWVHWGSGLASCMGPRTLGFVQFFVLCVLHGAEQCSMELP